MWLGLDIGSVSTKAVLLGLEDQILSSAYLPTAGDPVNAIYQCLEYVFMEYSQEGVLSSITTGSGRNLARDVIGAQKARNEITCQILGLSHYLPRTIIEIGGQDSKCMQLDVSGIPIWYNMNSVCSAGTGAYLTTTATRLGVPIQELGELALQSTRRINIAGRCSVFAESDLIHKQQMGVPKPDLVAGLCQALARNYLGSVALNRNLQPPVVFAGGVAKNIGVVRAFEEALENEIIVPEHPELSGALGAARLARSSPESPLNLSGEVETHYTECRKCDSYCEITVVTRNGSKVGALGARCELWEKVGEEVGVG